jgi:1-acyl-sn-glycerol-3-phosphate acyltransferase
MKEEITTPIIITNHVNWIETPYLGSCFRIISFVSKKEVKDVLFVNSIA